MDGTNKYYLKMIVYIGWVYIIAGIFVTQGDGFWHIIPTTIGVIALQNYIADQV
tara:strand:- start:267 stop:428 length:162 start_codon:yes stop_codon:yes gene_type:complete